MPTIKVRSDKFKLGYGGFLQSQPTLAAGSVEFQVPILADTLEEVGCNDAEILGHCRGESTHVGGCWVVDPILCKM